MSGLPRKTGVPGMLESYGVADDLWIPAKEAVGAKKHIAEFHKWNPEAPKHILAVTYMALPF